MPRRARQDQTAAKFGAIIRQLRNDLGWTLLDFSRKADMNPRYLGYIERGENVPTLTVAIHLAHVLGKEAAPIIAAIEET